MKPLARSAIMFQHLGDPRKYHQSEFSKLSMGGTARFCLSLVYTRDSQDYFHFLRFPRVRWRKGVEVFEKTGLRKTGGAKVPFDNFDPENYLGDSGLRNPAT